MFSFYDVFIVWNAFQTVLFHYQSVLSDLFEECFSFCIFSRNANFFVSLCFWAVIVPFWWCYFFLLYSPLSFVMPALTS